MIKSFIFINLNTKKGILQAVCDVDKISDDFIDDERIESFVIYNEVHNEDRSIDFDNSKFTSIYYIGTKISDNQVMTRSGNIYEIRDEDVVISTPTFKLK